MSRRLPSRTIRPPRPAALAPLLLALLLAATGVLSRGAAPESVTATADAADPRASVQVPVLMYHSILKDPARAGAYIISPAQFESDMVCLLDYGYTTVTVADLIAYVDGDGRLPEKPVVVTFDDGYYNNLYYVLPILERLDLCAVISVVGAFSDRATQEQDPNPNYAYLSWEDVRSLAESGRIEFQNHSYDMHGLNGRHGSARLDGESEAAYRAAFTGDAGRVQALLLEYAGAAATAYTYPYGSTCPEADALLREMGFRASFTCREQQNTLVQGDPNTLFNLGRYNRPAGELSGEYLRRALALGAD